MEYLWLLLSDHWLRGKINDIIKGNQILFVFLTLAVESFFEVSAEQNTFP